MKDALSRIAKNVIRGGLPKVFSPMVFAVTGTGRVAQGIIEVLEQLPHEKVEPDNLEAYLQSCENDSQRTKKIVISQFASKDLVQLKTLTDEPFDKSNYYKNPHLYESKFQKYLPFVSFLVNGIYWEPKYPRVLSTDELRLAHKSGKSALMGVCDISADAEGSVEFTRRFTSIEEPFLVYDTQKDEFYEKINQSNADSILFHSVDHLPAEMPKEASNHFGQALFPFVSAVANSNIDDAFSSQQESLPAAITGATICCHGQLTPKYSYIADLRKMNAKVNLDIQEIYEEMPDTDGAQIHSSSKQEAGMTLHAPKMGGKLKRNLSLVNITLQGHLFDTKCFNQCIDICEEFSI
jgi:alpha-aminoadipic semialdehyde synthase